MIPFRVPAGYAETEIRTFYFDENTARWEQVGYLTQKRGEVLAVAEHFTDFINSTLAMPDHPGTQSFNPTSIKDMKTADPAAGITLIQPPEPNNDGTARLSLPIEVPPGRHGVQPSLSMAYDSQAGSGWMGLGWDLRISSIQVETKFGVPQYDGTEAYLLDGEALVPICRPSGAPAGGQYFGRRVEGRFDRIRRLGTGPADYTWEVTDKSGTKLTYGSGTCSTNTCSRLANPKSPYQVFRWLLDAVEDTFGNRMTYKYFRDSEAAGSSGLGAEPWVQIYPQRIDYTFHPSLSPSYSVEFELADSASLGGGSDFVSDARAGFHVLTRKRLASVWVKINTPTNPGTIRRYSLRYKVGEFGKTLLDSVALMGFGGADKLDEHTFEYYGLPDSGKSGGLQVLHDAGEVGFAEGTTRLVRRSSPCRWSGAVPE